MINRIKVEYEGFDPKLDEKIKEAIEGIGFEWYGQGQATETKIRDIVFEKGA